jgi:hypothetical protein
MESHLQIEFDPTFDRLSGVLSRAEARDLIDVLYRWDIDRNCTFQLLGHIMVEKKRGHHTCGQHSFQVYENRHLIGLDLTQIEYCVKKKLAVGGSIKTPNMKICAGMVMAHEIQHANQVFHHARENRGSFYAQQKKYYGRPCEREARAFADDNVEVVAGILNQPVPYGNRPVLGMVSYGPDILAIADDLEGIREVSLSDLREELRSSGCASPENIRILREEMELRGTIVV